jgi:hypothetical protein
VIFRFYFGTAPDTTGLSAWVCLSTLAKLSSQNTSVELGTCCDQGGVFLNHGIARSATYHRQGASLLTVTCFLTATSLPISDSLRAAELSGFEVRAVRNFDCSVFGGIHFRTSCVRENMLRRAVAESVLTHEMRALGDNLGPISGSQMEVRVWRGLLDHYDGAPAWRGKLLACRRPYKAM